MDEFEGMTPAQAEARLNEIRADGDSPYYDKSKQGHDDMVRQVNTLTSIAIREAPPVSASDEGSDRTPLEGLPEFPPEAHTEDGQMRWHTETVQEYQAAAVELGFTGTEAMHWLDYYAKSFSRDLPDPEQTLTTLRQEWGADFGRKVNSAILAAQRLPYSVRLHLNESGLGDDPVLIRRMAEIGEQKGMSAAFEQIQKLKEDSAYWDRHDPRHKAVVNEMQRLAKQAYD